MKLWYKHWAGKDILVGEFTAKRPVGIEEAFELAVGFNSKNEEFLEMARDRGEMYLYEDEAGNIKIDFDNMKIEE